jgi:Ca2+-transporting ATPase
MSFSKFDGQNLDMLLIKPKEAASLDIPDLVSRLSTDIITGLTTSEIYLRQKIYGDNELKIHKTQSIIFRYINQFKDPLIMLLLLSSLISVVMKEFDNALSIAVAIIIVVSVGFVQEYRSEKSLEALSKLMPHNCRCIRDGSIEEILAESLVPGDIIEVNTGDRIPADIRLFESIDLEVDESSFTGETAPSIKTIETKTLTDIDISGFSVTLFKNLCFMGTYICSGHGKGIVFGTGANTEFGDIFKLMQSEESPKTPLQRSMDSLGKQLSFYSLCIIG